MTTRASATSWELPILETMLCFFFFRPSRDRDASEALSANGDRKQQANPTHTHMEALDIALGAAASASSAVLDARGAQGVTPDGDARLARRKAVSLIVYENHMPF